MTKQVPYQVPCKVPTVVYEDVPQKYFDRVCEDKTVTENYQDPVRSSKRVCSDSFGKTCADPNATGGDAAGGDDGAEPNVVLDAGAAEPTTLVQEGGNVGGTGSDGTNTSSWQLGGFN